jgi:hypothetical protein
MSGHCLAYKKSVLWALCPYIHPLCSGSGREVSQTSYGAILPVGIRYSGKLQDVQHLSGCGKAPSNQVAVPVLHNSLIIVDFDNGGEGVDLPADARITYSPF